MIHNVDYVIMSMIKIELENLRNNPDELSILMSSYMDLWSICELVKTPAVYIDQVVQLITNRDKPLIEVFQAFSATTPTNYGIYVTSSCQESNQFFGDYGSTEPQILTPTIYANNLTAHHIEDNGDRSVLFFRNTCNITEKVWRLQKAINPVVQKTFFVVSIIDDKKEYVMVELNDLVPFRDGVRPLEKWQFQALESGYNITYGISQDQCSVRVYLRTTGDIEVHKILCGIVRYCLKKSRQKLEHQNFQVSTFSMSSPTPEYSGENCCGFSTEFTITGKACDQWIMSKTRIPEKLTVKLQAFNDASIVDVGTV